MVDVSLAFSEPGYNLYAASILAIRLPSNLSHTAVVFVAGDSLMAYAIAMDKCKAMWPTLDGWQDHDVTVCTALPGEPTPDGARILYGDR